MFFRENGKIQGMSLVMAVSLCLLGQIAMAEDLPTPVPEDETVSRTEDETVSRTEDGIETASGDTGIPLENTEESANTDCREFPKNDALIHFSTALKDDLSESEQSLFSTLGLDDITISNVNQIRSFSQDKTLDYLLSVYQAYQSARNSSGMLDESELLTLLDEENELDARDRVTVVQTILPLLVDYAVSEGEASTIRRFSSQLRTYERLWPGQRFHIVCQQDETAIAFGLKLKERDNHWNVMGLKPLIEVCRDEVKPDAPSTEQTPVICYAVRGIESNSLTPESWENVLSRTLAALLSKDNQLVAMEMRHLLEAVGSLKDLPNADSSDVLNEQWLSRLHVISLLLLEQHRFIELMRLERGIQDVFKDGKFVNRLSLKCQDHLNHPQFSETYTRLETDYGNAYAWVKKQFAPKNIKKLDKNFKAWTKKGTANVKLLRRLIVMWALWSEGKYAQAAEVAGNVTEGKSRLVHPQLHSLDVILKAASGEEISQQALETYVRVIYLKSPWLTYQALSEAGHLFSKSQRKLAVSIMRQYNPADASTEAALFYREYEKEIREDMNVQHLSRIDAWLETELRAIENQADANQRRIRWLRDLIAEENWQEISGLSDLSIQDTPEEWRDFWKHVECHAQSSCDCSSISANMPFDCVLSENAESREAWFKQTASCLAKLF